VKPAAHDPLALLRRFSARNSGRERCDLCGAPLMPGHRHLFEVNNGRLACACDPCAWRFPSTLQGRFKLVPPEIQSLSDFQMTDRDWESLAIPIDLAFFFVRSSDGKRRALYPSPAGTTESFVSPSAWEALVRANPALANLEPDVQALLVNRVGSSRGYYLAPIDRCYELAGLIRVHWRGLAGGESVWKEIHLFFDRLKAETTPVKMGTGPPLPSPLPQSGGEGVMDGAASPSSGRWSATQEEHA
jgi:hypothetical protein